MARQLPIGEVVEIRTPVGLLAAQAAARSQRYGTLFYMPTRIYVERPATFERAPSIAVFSPLEVVIDHPYPAILFARVGKAPVPAAWQAIPTFRYERIDRATLESDWALWEGATDRDLESVSREVVESHPPLRVGTPFVLVYDALEAAGVDPERIGISRWFGIEDAASGKRRSPSHFLTFESEAAARLAMSRLADVGTVDLTQNEASWTVVFECEPDTFGDIDAAGSALEQLAHELGGRYDGREVPV